MDSVKFLGLLLFARLIDVAALGAIRCPEGNENVTDLALGKGLNSKEEMDVSKPSNPSIRVGRKRPKDISDLR